MKNLRKTLFLLTLLIICATNSSLAQSIPESEQIMVRTYESDNIAYPSVIIISYGDGKPETIKLENPRAKNYGYNAVTINQVLNNIRKEGYQLLTSNAGGGEGSSYISTYIFIPNK